MSLGTNGITGTTYTLHESENYVTMEQEAEHIKLKIQREKETGPQPLPDQTRTGQEIIYRNFGTTTVPRLGISIEYQQHTSDTTGGNNRHGVINRS